MTLRFVPLIGHKPKKGGAKEAYYPHTYKWDGSCQACGDDGRVTIETFLHEAGFLTKCACGRWSCQHDKGKNRYSHDSDGRWTALYAIVKKPPPDVRQCRGIGRDDLTPSTI